jgi:hypothetical protein
MLQVKYPKSRLSYFRFLFNQSIIFSAASQRLAFL